MVESFKLIESVLNNCRHPFLLSIIFFCSISQNAIRCYPNTYVQELMRWDVGHKYERYVCDNFRQELR